MTIIRRAAVLAATILVAGCAGGSTGSSGPSAPHAIPTAAGTAAPTNGAKGTVAFKVLIPKPRPSSAAKRRNPKFISPNAVDLVVTFDVGGSAVSTQTLALGGSSCSPTGGTDGDEECTFSLTEPTDSGSLFLQTIGPDGTVLGNADVEVSVPDAGTVTENFVIVPVVAGLQSTMTPLIMPADGNAHTGTVTTNILDPDGNIITDPYFGGDDVADPQVAPWYMFFDFSNLPDVVIAGEAPGFVITDNISFATSCCESVNFNDPTSTGNVQYGVTYDGSPTSAVDGSTLTNFTLGQAYVLNARDNPPLIWSAGTSVLIASMQLPTSSIANNQGAFSPPQSLVISGAGEFTGLTVTEVNAGDPTTGSTASSTIAVDTSDCTDVTVTPGSASFTTTSLAQSTPFTSTVSGTNLSVPYSITFGNDTTACTIVFTPTDEPTLAMDLDLSVGGTVEGTVQSHKRKPAAHPH